VAEIRRAEAADSPYQPLLETALNSIGDGNGATWGLTPTSSASWMPSCSRGSRSRVAS